MLPPAKSMDDMHAVVTNSTVDGMLAAFFAILIIIVIADATRISIKAIRAARAADHRGPRHGVAPARAVRPLRARGRARAGGARMTAA